MNYYTDETFLFCTKINDSMVTINYRVEAHNDDDGNLDVQNIEVMSVSAITIPFGVADLDVSELSEDDLNLIENACHENVDVQNDKGKISWDMVIPEREMHEDR